jgi:hypothetical protein
MNIGNCASCHSEVFFDIRNEKGFGKGAKLDVNQKQLHVCKQQQNKAVQAQDLPQTAREKRIDELAVARTAALDRIAAALEKNDNQNIADALHYLAQSLTEMSRSIKALVVPPEVVS